MDFGGVLSGDFKEGGQELEAAGCAAAEVLGGEADASRFEEKSYALCESHLVI